MSWGKNLTLNTQHEALCCVVLCCAVLCCAVLCRAVPRSLEHRAISADGHSSRMHVGTHVQSEDHVTPLLLRT